MEEGDLQGTKKKKKIKVLCSFESSKSKWLLSPYLPEQFPRNGSAS
jgi:hypothetical protein